MKRAIVFAPCDLRWEEQDRASKPLEPNEARVRTQLTAVSPGTEISMYNGTHKRYQTADAYPTAIGYLNVGHVTEIGAEVANVMVGDRVFSRAGHTSEYVEKECRLIHIPDNVNSEQASLNYLVTLGLHALRRAAYTLGENVAIIGLGVIGLTAGIMAKASGANVVGIDVTANRLAVGEKLGFDMIMNPTDPLFHRQLERFARHSGIDLVIEAAGSWQTVAMALELVRSEGRIAILARHHDLPNFNPLGEQFYKKQVQLIATSNDPWGDEAPGRGRLTLEENCRYVLSLMNRGDIDLAPVITHRFSHSDLGEVYRRLADGDKEMIGILLNWS